MEPPTPKCHNFDAIPNHGCQNQGVLIGDDGHRYCQPCALVANISSLLTEIRKQNDVIEGQTGTLAEMLTKQTDSAEDRLSWIESYLHTLVWYVTPWYIRFPTRLYHWILSRRIQ